MDYAPTLSGYSEQWDEYHAVQAAKNELATLAQRANIHASACWSRRGESKSSDWGTQLLRNLTNQFQRGCSLDTTRRHPRYWQFMKTYPGARTIWKAAFPDKDPDTGFGVGDPFPPLARQYDSRTMQWYEMPGPFLAGRSEFIDGQIGEQQLQANYLRNAINDWLFQHGVNGNVMNMQELNDYVDYINEQERGDPIMPLLIEAAAPQVPAGQSPYARPDMTPPAPAPGFFTLENFNIRRSWPGLVAGAAAALLMG